MLTLMLTTLLQTGALPVLEEPPPPCPKVTSCCVLTDDRPAGLCCQVPARQRVPCV